MAFTPFDTEFENFIDFDNGFHSPSGLQSPSTFSLDPTQSMFSADSFENRQTFPGPSHEYSRYRQLTGLPTGAMTAIPLDAEIKMEDFSMMPSTQSMPFMDFNNSTFNFDSEFDPMQQDSTYFFNENMNSFADTSAMTTQPPMQMPIIPAQQQRLYPGMHTQQAQQAQAEAAARQQRQQQMGREIMQQQQQQLPQLHRPSIGGSTASMPATRANSVVSVADSGVDNKISRLLDQMRNNSNMDIIDEEPGSPSDEPSRSGRSKKEEEDMDEDERLLASEEGKKLSSKERRQLRNKVSARAFRSRRKEYIGQLEGEVAAKVAECDELKRRNRHQAEQIAQLTQLTRSLLSHPAFATFAEDLSNDPTILAQPTTTSATSSTSSTSTVKPSQQKMQNKEQQQQQSTTESDSQQQQQQQQSQQSSTTSRNSLDFSMLNLGSSHWNASGTGYSFQQPTVMAVYDVPCPDVFSERTLSGKDDVLTQILSPLNMSRPTATPKAQEPRLSQVGDAQEDAFVPILTHAVDSTTSASAFETDQMIDEINAAFDQFDLQIRSLNVMLGGPACHERCN